ncbi:MULTISPECIES: amino acid ABC transporter permease [Bifidobacterium]|jgi:glutamate transport system permease protein|uniref:amino acid ABC transporter permease n=1 Tax=Bifidobacterium TaxID=1678 RepID=UPI002352675F|nr:amino acid ABC transporter permease [Bifidobacterium tibiigranuli]MCH3975808.1 amino acid ABC transporter permease [Bifidobacterium tibiigranuli]MCH4189272.1 amino acid ABC transporter permease [Bifidobacterium tibiigranuli]MCH4203093.1 amino acid ABC transporter permease [Bifidobacterium tibiigranuli]MCH4274758.1 amino acid ABC transporter permease [Bifidobacterium tibiigranuli]MCI1211634.1 amino acid ABC transporter permease [Bifidobacterium tibiigranuli]
MAMTPTEAALFEAAGPRARRRILIGTIATSLVFAALVVWLLMRLDANGQFDSQYWDLFASVNTWKFLGAGFIGTIRASLSAGVIALVGGLVLMFGRISGIAPVRWLATAVIEFVRGTPTLLFIYFFFLVPSQFGIHMSTYWMVVIPVSFYASAVLAEVYRAGVQAVPAGQREAAESLGLGRWQVYSSVILPQMFRIIVPTMVTQLVVVVKDTTFGYVVTYPEMMQNAKVIVANSTSMLPVYLIVALIYILVNYAISRFARWLSSRSDVKILAA